MSETKGWRKAVQCLAVTNDPKELTKLVEELVIEFRKPVYGTALQLSRGDEELAADIFQETFLRIIESRKQIRSPVAFPRFLKVVTLNIGRDILRQRGSERILDAERAEEMGVPLEDLLVTRLYLQAYLDQLEPLYADVLISKFFKGEEDSVTAERLGKTPQNVRVLRHRALTKMRALIGEENFFFGSK